MSQQLNNQRQQEVHYSASNRVKKTKKVVNNNIPIQLSEQQSNTNNDEVIYNSQSTNDNNDLMANFYKQQIQLLNQKLLNQQQNTIHIQEQNHVQLQKLESQNHDQQQYYQEKLQEQLQQIQTQMQTQTSKQHQLQGIQQQVKQLQEAIKAKDLQINSLQNKNDTLQQQFDGLTQKHSVLVEEHKQYNDQLSILNNLNIDMDNLTKVNFQFLQLKETPENINKLLQQIIEKQFQQKKDQQQAIQKKQLSQSFRQSNKKAQVININENGDNTDVEQPQMLLENQELQESNNNSSYFINTNQKQKSSNEYTNKQDYVQQLETQNKQFQQQIEQLNLHLEQIQLESLQQKQQMTNNEHQVQLLQQNNEQLLLQKKQLQENNIKEVQFILNQSKENVKQKQIELDQLIIQCNKQQYEYKQDQQLKKEIHENEQKELQQLQLQLTNKDQIIKEQYQQIDGLYNQWKNVAMQIAIIQKQQQCDNNSNLQQQLDQQQNTNLQTQCSDNELNNYNIIQSEQVNQQQFTILYSSNQAQQDDKQTQAPDTDYLHDFNVDKQMQTNITFQQVITNNEQLDADQLMNEYQQFSQKIFNQSPTQSNKTKYKSQFKVNSQQLGIEVFNNDEFDYQQQDGEQNQVIQQSGNNVGQQRQNCQTTDQLNFKQDDQPDVQLKQQNFDQNNVKQVNYDNQNINQQKSITQEYQVPQILDNQQNLKQNEYQVCYNSILTELNSFVDAISYNHEQKSIKFLDLQQQVKQLNCKSNITYKYQNDNMQSMNNGQKLNFDLQSTHNKIQANNKNQIQQTNINQLELNTSNVINKNSNSNQQLEGKNQFDDVMSQAKIKVLHNQNQQITNQNQQTGDTNNQQLLNFNHLIKNKNFQSKEFITEVQNIIQILESGQNVQQLLTDQQKVILKQLGYDIVFEDTIDQNGRVQSKAAISRCTQLTQESNIADNQQQQTIQDQKQNQIDISLKINQNQQLQTITQTLQKVNNTNDQIQIEQQNQISNKNTKQLSDKNLSQQEQQEEDEILKIIKKLQNDEELSQEITQQQIQKIKDYGYDLFIEQTIEQSQQDNSKDIQVKQIDLSTTIFKDSAIQNDVNFQQRINEIIRKLMCNEKIGDVSDAEVEYLNTLGYDLGHKSKQNQKQNQNEHLTLSQIDHPDQQMDIQMQLIMQQIGNGTIPDELTNKQVQYLKNKGYQIELQENSDITDVVKQLGNNNEIEQELTDRQIQKLKQRGYDIDHD